MNHIDFISNISMVNSIINKRLDAVLGSLHGISYTEFLILYYINKELNHTIRRIDLAQALGLTASGITRSLKPLEKIGLIEKESNQRDARVSLVKITKAGQKVLKNSTITLNEKIEILFKDLQEELVENALSVLNHLSSQNRLF